MIKLAFVCIVLVAFTVQPSLAKKTRKECSGEFEFWGCESSTVQCQRLCENRVIDRSKISCALNCQHACVCEAGYLRNGIDGECVYETECPRGGGPGKVIGQGRTQPAAKAADGAPKNQPRSNNKPTAKSESNSVKQNSESNPDKVQQNFGKLNPGNAEPVVVSNGDKQEKPKSEEKSPATDSERNEDDAEDEEEEEEESSTPVNRPTN